MAVFFLGCQEEPVKSTVLVNDVEKDSSQEQKHQEAQEKQGGIDLKWLSHEPFETLVEGEHVFSIEASSFDKDTTGIWFRNEEEICKSEGDAEGRFHCKANLTAGHHAIAFELFGQDISATSELDIEIEKSMTPEHDPKQNF